MSAKQTLCRDLVGKQVTLPKGLATRGGVAFWPGEAVQITATAQGRFDIRAADGRVVTHVERSDFAEPL